jgi:serine/threonine-protein kinase
MRALAAAGDTAAALQHARSHERAVREELEESPSPEVADLAMKLRTATAAPSPRAPSVARDGAANAEPYLAFVRERLMSRYAVHRIVGRTSLVTIFDATGARDDAPVMLRVIVPDLLSRADTTRLVAGLEAAARPRGEHIAPIGDVGVLGGLVFTATSPLVAPALRERLEVERHLKIDAALDIAIAVAAALACGDSHGIPHLDLTPRRILLDSQTRLADLGLMHAVVGSLTHNPAESGAALGTPAYLSPEQLAGEAVNGSLSDIYSLGCILYQMLAGEPPHSSTNTRALVARRLGHEPPRVRELRESVPAALDGLVARMVARIPADRVPSASALHEELRAIRATAGRD